MTAKIEILEIARLEFDEAKEFFEIEQPGLGTRFEEEIKHSLLRIQQSPQAWPPERKEIRRYILHKSPTRFFIPFKTAKSSCLHLHIYIESQIIGLTG